MIVVLLRSVVYRVAYYRTACEDQPEQYNCVLGLKELPIYVKNSTFLYANKMVSSFDFGAIDCWYEELFKRTYQQPERGIRELNKQFYTDIPHVLIERITH